MIPESCHGLLGYRIVIVAHTIIIEDGKLVFGHDITRWLGLNSSPYVADAPFKHRRHGGMNLAILVVLGYLESFAQCELSRW